MPEKKTYGQILKSSAIIGGSSLVNIGIGVIRTKFMAILLGPSGVGLMGLYSSITDLAINIAGMGINSSGVRQIAEAVGSENSERIARTAIVLRRVSFFLGLFGAVMVWVFSKYISELTFGNDHHAVAISLLSLGVFFSTISAGQGALIQGMRRISELAKMGILGTLLGALISITVIFFFGEKGVAPSLVLIAGMTVITSWWYSRKIIIDTVSISLRQLGVEASALLKLGFAFMFSSLLMAGSAYVIRLIVVRKVGFDAAGLYQSAWTLGGLYLGFILQAMGTDFYPRLTAVINNNSECNRLVNEQAHVSLLLAGPGVIATLTFAPVIISVFYTAKFQGAIEILRWLCLGMALRVISWPMGFIIMAKGVQNIIIFSELAWTFVYLVLAWLCVLWYGLSGTGMAFFLSYIFHVVMIYLIVRRLTGFEWSFDNIKTCSLFIVLISVVFASFYWLPFWYAMGMGILATLISAFYSIKVLLVLVSVNRVPGPIQKLLALCRLTSVQTTNKIALNTTSTFTKDHVNKKQRAYLTWLLTFVVIVALGFVISQNGEYKESWPNWINTVMNYVFL